MDQIQQFREKLIEKGNEEKVVNQVIDTLLEYQDFLNKREKNIENATEDDFYDFSAQLIEKKENEYLSYHALEAFGEHTDNFALVKWARSVYDGAEVIKNLSRRLTDEFGQDLRDEIFDGIDLPEPGIHPKEKPRYILHPFLFS